MTDRNLFPCDVALYPHLATLAVLHAALTTSRMALLAEHDRPRSAPDTDDELVTSAVAFTIVHHANALLELLNLYRHALEHERQEVLGADLPF